MDRQASGLSLIGLTYSWCSPKSRMKNFARQRPGRFVEHCQWRLTKSRELARKDQEGTVEQLCGGEA